MSNQFIRSCLRWPGNKFSILKDILPLFPKTYNNYHEPFLGAASVFINSDHHGKAYLSDSNHTLINFYVQVRDNLTLLIDEISKKQNTEQDFYRERDHIYNNQIEQAAQFYYLNRTCFNGIYRVNSSGKFNVPYGFRDEIVISDEKLLLHLKQKLKTADITCHDFSTSIQNINPNDFVFLDPPYSSKKQSNTFNMYNDKLFKWEDQLRLKDFCVELNKLDVKYMLTNLYNDDIYKLFAKELGLKCLMTQRYSGISSHISSRGNYREYIFLNYKP